MNRIERENKTIVKMVKVYCASVHGRSGVLCDECFKILEYSQMRLQKCRWGDKKPVCNKCTVHCYQPEYQDAVKKVMRYSGPRMFFHAPLLAIAHFFDTIRG